MYAQNATENVFEKNIPFRSFEINKRDERSLGELFVLYTWNNLNWKMFKFKSFDQPTVELIKKETKNFI